MPHCADPACRDCRLRETIRAELSLFRSWMEARDNLVRDAVLTGVPKAEVSRRAGLARSTIDKILAGHDA